MSSNVISRLLPVAAGSPSIYETLREHDRPEDDTDDDPDNMMEAEIDEQNLIERFQDQDLDELLAEAAQSGITTESTPFITQDRPIDPRASRLRNGPRVGRPRWMQDNTELREEDDVPESLLFEEGKMKEQTTHRLPPRPSQDDQELPPPVPGPSHATFSPGRVGVAASPRYPRGRYQADTGAQAQAGLLMTDPFEKAMWRWTNVVNLDTFLIEVYDYYLGKGIWSIILSRLLSLLTFAFVGVLLSFLTLCIDYRSLPGSKALPEVIIPQCTQKIAGINNVVIWVVSFLWIWKLFQYLLDIRRLYHLHDFYHYLLGIPDTDMQTISWPTVVERLMDLRDANPRTAVNITAQARKLLGENSKQRMDAHDIANRIMRKENYLIALFNKEVLDISLPIPFLGKRQLFSKTLEWNINFCVMDIVFSSEGQVRQLFLKDSHRKELIEMVQRRFIFAGYMNAVCAPFIAFYLVAFYVLRFFIEFQRNPAALGARAYTPLAEWKFREFNELWHMFERRIDMSYPFASRYIDQFPKDKTVQVARFVAFVSGALGAVLAIASLLDPDVFFGFEITHDRTVLFYLGVLGTIWAVTRGVVPEENLVFDPEFAIQNVIDYTHYQPAHWTRRLHSDEVRQEFAQLYRPKVLNFLEELLSIIFTPFILWFCLPRCSERLVDFFREFTVHVDGLGYVCSFALFEFQKGGPTLATVNKDGQARNATEGLREDYYSTKDNKMLASYFNFIDTYSNNPRRPVPRESKKRDFHPPPPFPGLTTSQMTVTEAGPSVEAPQAPVPAMASAIFRTKATQGDALQTSPSPSLLLDPRHQPAASILRRPHRQHELSSLRHGEVLQTEHSGSYYPEDSTAHQPSSSGMGMEESRLGDSWKTTRGTQAEDEESVTDVEGLQGEGGAGVLGMIYQFQKAQTEGRVVGI